MVNVVIKRRRVTDVALALLALAGCNTAYGMWNARNIHIGYHEVRSPKLENVYKIGYLTDLHAGYYNYKTLLETVAKLKDKKLDALILGGDIIDANTPDELVGYIIAWLASAAPTGKVFWVWGNHDMDIRSECSYSDESLLTALKANHICNLSEEVIHFGPDLAFYGREDESHPDKYTRRHLKDAPIVPYKYNVLVDHAPTEQKLAASVGFDLMLSGHMHDGQFAYYKAMLKATGEQVAGWRMIDRMLSLNSPGAGVSKFSRVHSNGKKDWLPKLRYFVRLRTASRCTCHVITLRPECDMES